ncbi:MAG: type VI secretion system tip protein VgrG [Rhodocyclaceae bacterium]|nr:type VI secretion system tip protein VgrG [Rhodocyclaceae bacterium]MBX3667534.1 type VI secretion system tip protein VgrG [Rhodocyclaceae bacterium]
MPAVTATITSNGSAMDPAYQVLAIDVVREVNRIPYARLTLIDGDVAKRKFEVSDSGFFDPGNKIDIKLRWEGVPSSEKLVFSGLVVAQSIETDPHRSLLTVDLKDAAVKLTRSPTSMVFNEQTDDEVTKAILGAQGIKAGDIAATKAKHEKLVQFGCTDWDFIMSRADVNGLLACVTDGSLSLVKPKLSGSPKKSFDYGIDEIYAIELEADAQSQYSDISSVAWDPKDQQMSSPAAAQNVNLAPGNLSASGLAAAIGGDKRVLASPAPASSDELQSWADATLARGRLALVRGRLCVPGLTDLAYLDLIEIKGVGKHFTGKALLTGWRHRVSDQGWMTDLRLGLGVEWFAARSDVAARPAAGLLPPIGGLQIGLVEGYEDDPEKEFRVKVRVPVLGADQPPLWARLAAPDAGKGRGYFFRPEAGDEVVLGFFNDDPRQPVIIGALFGSANTPPEGLENLSDKNENKGLVSRAGTKILFKDTDSGKSALNIETASGNKIVLDDDAKSITITDQHGNSVAMDQNGMTLKSAKDFTLEASGKVQIKGSEVDVN